MDLITAFLQTFKTKKDNLSNFEDTAQNSFNQSPIGLGMDAMGKEDATFSSVYNAAKKGMSKTEDEQLSVPQGVIGMQQPTFTQPNYMGGIPSLLQGYGNSSQGLLPYIGAR